MKLDEAAAVRAIQQVPASLHMAQLSGRTRETGAAVFKWHGTRMVGHHLQLFTSWCKRSADSKQHLTAKTLIDCAAQWAAKVPHGRLALHEKIMGVCGMGVGAVAKVCEFAPVTVLKRLVSSRRLVMCSRDLRVTTRLEACLLQHLLQHLLVATRLEDCSCSRRACTRTTLCPCSLVSLFCAHDSMSVLCTP